MAKTETVVQVDLASGTKVRTCWVEPRVRVGNVITLKNADEPARLWRVLRVSEPAPRASLHTDWHNNI